MSIYSFPIYVINNIFYHLLHREDYSMVKYSVSHFADFYRGLAQIAELLEDLDLPPSIKFYTDRIGKILKEPPLERLANSSTSQKFTRRQNLFWHIRAPLTNVSPRPNDRQPTKRRCKHTDWIFDNL